MIPYPAWRFGPEGVSVVVHSPEEDSQLGKGWSDKVPEGFRPEGHPTYPSAHLVPQPVDVEAIAEEVKRKPGRPKKVE